MKDKKMKIQYKILTVAFIAIISILCFVNLNSIRSIVKTGGVNEDTLFNFDSSFESVFYAKGTFININGLLSKIMRQKIVNNTIKGNNDKLYTKEHLTFRIHNVTANNDIKNLVNFSKYAKDKGAQFLYTEHPFKYIPDTDKLPYNYKDENNLLKDLRIKAFKKNDVNCLDLRDAIRDNVEYYKTDHHWTVGTSFYAAEKIITKLQKKNIIFGNVDKIKTIKNYHKLFYGNSLLGSGGIRVGEYYVGKDDFAIPVPNFHTNLSYKHYDNKHSLVLSKSGKFEEALIDRDVLEDKNYYNKYNACLFGGWCENRITNNESPNDLKLLLVSDSYSRSMAMYMSLYFNETRFLDPQDGRYNDSYKEYVDVYKPDIIVVMYDYNIPGF